MPLNKCKGSMYVDVDFTQNIIRGRCPFNCRYCSTVSKYPMNRIKAYHRPFHYDPRELKVAYPSGTRIFIGSATDMWKAPENFIEKVLRRCREVDSVLSTPGLAVHWVFQSKEPREMAWWIPMMPQNVTLITTLETNRYGGYDLISSAPHPGKRAGQMVNLRNQLTKLQPVMHIDLSVTIEPVMTFDHQRFIRMLQDIAPQYVSIGAATLNEYKKYGMEKPTWVEIVNLVSDLQTMMEVRVKKNVLRLATTKGQKEKMRDQLESTGAWLTWEWVDKGDTAKERYNAWLLWKIGSKVDHRHEGFTEAFREGMHRFTPDIVEATDIKIKGMDVKFKQEPGDPYDGR